MKDLEKLKVFSRNRGCKKGNSYHSKKICTWSPWRNK